ncbi:thiolase family protein [Carboxydothermus pertinax]|uniref:Acetyl-CoA acetyltransferase n=1 Tax=Carboxydothermus pertinax TaxID=870242 RepID=A0A1L8CXF0_9THEO|nr:thiolase family protein [Carboxydothermus pertinax]GAV23573.1 acetyl-CoA acetyltransferase [Carboxydothermus pertinax]
MRDVVIVRAKRTPIGSFGGQFKNVSAGNLAAAVIKALLQELPFPLEKIDEVILGNCLMNTDEPNLGRTAALMAGLPHTTTGFTVQRQCSSGMQAIVSAYQELALGDNDIIIAGGVESMSTAPFVLKTARWGQRLTHGEMTDALWELLTDPQHKILMGVTAENLARKYNISREEQDEVAYRSHKLAVEAMDNGWFSDEIVPVEVAKSKKEKVSITTDEHPRRDVTLERLAALPPAFVQDGTVTAGNSSGLNDGAAAVLMMREETARQYGLEPLGYIRAYAWAGVEPELMGYGPVPAVQKLLKKTGLSLSDIDLIELNEAFAAQYLACEKLLELDRSKVNVKGSGIALGHPVGATGARIIVTLLYELKRRNLKRGVATLCVGGGMGMAVLVER